MDLAVPALVIVFLAFPGLFFRRFYYSGEFSTAFFEQSAAESIFLSIPYSILIHAFLGVAFQAFRIYPDTDTLSALLQSEDENTVRTAIASLSRNCWKTFSYHLTASTMGCVLGYLSRQLVRSYRLDLRYLTFRFPNNWHYILTGEALDFGSDAKKELASKVDLVYVDALMNTSEGSVIYSGLLDHYLLSKSGGLDLVVLSEGTRRYLRNDPKSISVIAKDKAPPKPIKAEEADEGAYYVMPGDRLCLPYAQILNLHLTYYAVEEVKAEPERNDSPKAIAT